MNMLKNKWDESYEKADNYLFYPDYNVIWFVAKFIKRRIGLDEYRYIRDFNTALDLGCGIGSNVLFLNEYGFDVYGVDISDKALEFAKERITHTHTYTHSGMELIDKLVQTSADALPFENDKFDFIISHGVLDSMPLMTAKSAFSEAYRVLSKNGLFYISLICSDGVRLPPEFNGEIIVEDEHENGTIQLYYNWTLINEMINNKFNILECKLTTEQWYKQVNTGKRYSLVLEKK